MIKRKRRIKLKDLMKKREINIRRISNSNIVIMTCDHTKYY